MKSIFKIENLNVENNGTRILKDISLNVNSGEILGIVGESGCGKSTLIRSMTRMLKEDEKTISGNIIFDDKDLLKLNKEEMRRIRGKEMGIVFQNPASTLNPTRKIGKQFIETIRSHEKISRKECKDKMLDIFYKLNLRDGKCMIDSYPFELSGGMNQRMAIALAMIMEPKVLIGDEPTSALDVTVQGQVINELINLREKFGTSIIIVTHSMGVVSHMADKVAVMYAGEIVEYGTKEEVLKNPCHPYTKSLINAVPKMNGKLPEAINGNPPNFKELKEGCSFAERCSFSREECKCQNQRLSKINEDHYISCSVMEESTK